MHLMPNLKEGRDDFESAVAILRFFFFLSLASTMFKIAGFVEGVWWSVETESVFTNTSWISIQLLQFQPLHMYLIYDIKNREPM